MLHRKSLLLTDYTIAEMKYNFLPLLQTSAIVTACTTLKSKTEAMLKFSKLYLPVLPLLVAGDGLKSGNPMTGAKNYK